MTLMMGMVSPPRFRGSLASRGIGPRAHRSTQGRRSGLDQSRKWTGRRQAMTYVGGMSGYGQFCPLARASEVVTRRWTPLVLRELLAGSRHFNDIHRGVPRMSRSLLARRLAELETAGVVRRRLVSESERPEYLLTRAGQQLGPVLEGLGAWGKRHLEAEIRREDLDASLLMWDVQRRLVGDRLPRRRVVVRFRFRGAPGGQRDYWLVLDSGAVDLCLEDPGHEADLTLRTDVATFTAIWLGDIPFARATELGKATLTGPAGLRRGFPSWLGLSPFAAIAREGPGTTP
ncbi:transcriptional regulator [bacterium]|nr:transcriptional regulator [bacterium]